MGKKSPAAPAAPDPVVTAQAQAASNVETAREQARLNRINQYTPYGKMTYRRIGETPQELAKQYAVGGKTFDDLTQAQAYATTLNPIETGKGQYATPTVQTIGGGYKVGGITYQDLDAANKAAQNAETWEQVTTLSPEQQALYDIQVNAAKQYGNIGLNQLGQLQESLSTPIDFSSLGSAPTANEETRTKTVNALLERMSPQFSQDRAKLEQQLASKGFIAGSEAWNREMDRLSRSETDARLAAEQQGLSAMSQLYNIEQQKRNQALNELVQQRQIPLNELSALISGSQVTQPSFTSVPQVGVSGTDLMGATYNTYGNQMNAYNQQQANQNALTGSLLGGLSSLGSSYIMSGVSPFTLSDRRFKKNINKIGKLKNGLNIYSFNYIWSNDNQIGFMADEVKKINPNAVINIYGIDIVNYKEAING